MYSCQIFEFIVLFIVLYSTCKGCNVDKTGRKPIITALLDLHTGENCDIVKFHGFQQLAVLQSTLEKINAHFFPERVEIKLLVFDTCSTTKGTVLATLNALVAAEQTCMETPFFLGFIGNENGDDLEASKNISKVFNIAHVVPHSYDLNFRYNGANFVSSYPVKQHTEAVKIIFEKLGIHNFIILHENISLSIRKLNHLVDEAKEELCFIKSVMFVGVDDLKHQLMPDLNEDALLIIIENVNILDELTEYLMGYSKQIIVSAGKVGAGNFLSPLVKSAFILQFTSLTPLGNLSQFYDEKLVKTYDEQQLMKCLKNKDELQIKCNSSIVKALNIKEKDWTVDLFRYGMLLFGKSVEIATNKKCSKPSGGQGWCSKVNSISQKEWHHILKESSTLDNTKGVSNEKTIKFNMDISGKFLINLVESGYIRLVGQIEGASIQMNDNYKFPTLDKKKNSKCLEIIPSITTTTVLPTTNKIHFETSLIPVDGLFNFDIRDYEMIGILSGIVFGIVFLLSLFVYFVYATVRVKSGCSDSSSIGSVNTRITD